MTKKIIFGLILLAYPVYFGFAMHLNNPFGFVSEVKGIDDTNSSWVIDNYVFSNNRGKLTR